MSKTSEEWASVGKESFEQTDNEQLFKSDAKERMRAAVRRKRGMSEEDARHLWMKASEEILRGEPTVKHNFLSREEFFDRICKDCETDRDRIAALIYARGFLIERRDSRYGMDWQENNLNGHALDKELRRLLLGSVYCGEIVIFDNARWENAKELFNCEGIGGEVCQYKNVSWMELANYRGKIAIETTRLEPFIALYVRAINLCGVRTVGCCDGNHPGKHEAFVQFYGEPFRAWHRFIVETLIGGVFAKLWSDDGCTIYFGNETQYTCYFSLFKAAQYLLNNHETIMGIRNDWMSAFSQEELESSAAKEIAPAKELASKRVREAPLWGDGEWNTK